MSRTARVLPLLLALVVVGALAARGADEASPPVERPSTLEELMRTMADTPGVVAEFTETKHFAILEAPLETRGTLYFIPPNRMARYTSHPGSSALIIDGDRLVFDDEAGGDRVDLAANTVARAFVENFIVLFNGDINELRARYEATFALDGDQWSLLLVPRRDLVAKMIASITLRGDDTGMRAMVMLEPGGDTSETRFTSLDSAHRFSNEEIDRLFRRAEPTPP